MKTHLKRLLSGMLSMVMTVSAIPIVSAHAEDSTEPYPYTIFAASDVEGAITVNARNFCVNGNVATNGTIVSSGNMNVNGARTENAAESMIFIFDKIDYQYFSGSNVDEHEEDYVLDELNINVNVPTEVQGETSLTGNVNINSALKSMEDINLFGEVKNTNDSIIFSKYGDIVIDSQNVNLNGLVYAPFGTVDITAQNLNLNNVVIIADSIILNCPNVNANNSSNMSSFVGNASEGLDIPVEEWVYMKDENENGLPDFFEIPSNMLLLPDSDGDYIPDCIENVLHMDSALQDTDGDGLTDGFEALFTLTSPLTADSDGNGVNDGCEDFDDDGVINSLEEAYFSNPHNKDTDGDGLFDGDEIHLTLTNPILWDTDGDTLSDFYEINVELDPCLKDTDGNGTPDNEEFRSQSVSFTIEDDDVIQSITISANATGILNQNTSIENITKSDRMCAEVVGLVGAPYDIHTNCAIENATISFTMDLNKMGEIALEDLLFLWYDEENQKFEVLDTTYDTNTNTVSAETTHFSKYMVVDKYQWYETWSVQLDYRRNPHVTGPFLGDIKRLSTVLAIDCSSSMSGIDDIKIDSTIQSAFDSQFPKTCGRIVAGNRFISLLTTDDKAGIVMFESNVNSNDIFDMTNDKLSLRHAMQNVRNSGGTNFNAALIAAYELFSNDDLTDTNCIKQIILMSDGGDNVKNETRQLLDTIYGVNSLDSRRSVRIDTVAFGNSADKAFLEEIAGMTGGTPYTAETASDLIKLYTSMAEDEFINFTDTTDTDGDGLYDVFEIVGMRLANGQFITTDPLNPDTDGDGVIDGDEITGMAFWSSETRPIAMKDQQGRLVKDESGEQIQSYMLHGPYFEMWSNPKLINSDGDEYDDKIDPYPLDDNLVFNVKYTTDDNYADAYMQAAPQTPIFTKEHWQQSCDTWNSDTPDSKYVDNEKDPFWSNVLYWPATGLGAIAFNALPFSFFINILQGSGFSFDKTYIASAYLMHYLGHSGETVTISQPFMAELITCQEFNKEHFANNMDACLIEAEAAAEKAGNGTALMSCKPDALFSYDTEYRGMYVSCFVAHTANGEDSNCPMAHSGTVGLWGIAATDWSFAVGQGFGSMRGRVKKNADGTYTMTYRYYLCDIYEWCVDHSTNEMNIEDKMYALHLYGWAKQFLIDGYLESTITWRKGERLSSKTELYNSTISNLIHMSMEATTERIRQGTYVVA